MCTLQFNEITINMHTAHSFTHFFSLPLSLLLFFKFMICFFFCFKFNTAYYLSRKMLRRGKCKIMLNERDIYQYTYKIIMISDGHACIQFTIVCNENETNRVIIQTINAFFYFNSIS